jgi:two-component system sensor histidine kinase HydH
MPTKLRLVNVSPWILAAACSLLAVIIAVFAVNNYHREKQLMMEVLLQKGITIIRFINAGPRTRFRTAGESPAGLELQWLEQVQQTLDHATEQPDIHLAMLVNRDGEVLVSSDREKIGGRIAPETGSFFTTLPQQELGNVVYRIGREARGDSEVFQIAAYYAPLGPFGPAGDGHGPMMRMGRGNGGMREHMLQMQQGFRQWREMAEQVQAARYVLLVELEIDQYNAAVKRQLLQIVILSVVLLLVGVGGGLSLFTLQGYKGSQISLRRMRAFNDLLVSSLPIGLVATDTEGRIQLCNRTAEDLIEKTEHQLVGKRPGDVLPPPLAVLISQSEAEPERPQRCDLLLERGEGRSRALLLAALAVIDGDRRHVGTMLLMQDVSEVKQLEEELKRNERLAALGEMAAGVAHELRNPLSSIKGLALLLKSKFTANSTDREAADILVREVERLNRSIGELLDYARPDRLEKATVSLNEIVGKALTLLRVDADAAGIQIVTEYCPPPDLVHADQDKLSQVFLNLLLNAIQAMKNGGILQVVTVRDPGQQLLCRIQDSGCGIEAELLPKIFDPYVTTKSSGTGLGLAMSVKIIEEHGGRIDISSTPGQGTTVVVALPAWQQ